MKALLKNRTVSICITVMIVILATLFGSHRSLTAAAYPVERYFIEGEDAYSIQQQLDVREELARNLMVVAEQYLYVDDVALIDLENALTAMEDADTVKEKSAANQLLTTATERMDYVLAECQLSSADNRYRLSLRSDLAACNQNIRQSEYNTLVTTYNTDVLGKFPANILKKMTFVSELETF